MVHAWPNAGYGLTFWSTLKWASEFRLGLGLEDYHLRWLGLEDYLLRSLAASASRCLLGLRHPPTGRLGAYLFRPDGSALFSGRGD